MIAVGFNQHVVTLRQARLVVRSVTVRRFMSRSHHIGKFSQPSRPTQPGHLPMARWNEWWQW